MTRSSISGATAILVILMSTAAVQAQKTPTAVFDSYLAALEEMRWDDAEACWTPRAITRAHTTEISYANVPVKLDCASPLTAALSAIRNDKAKISVETVSPASDTTRLTVRIISATDTVTTTYYAENASSGWRLTSPLYYYSHGWKIHPTAYVDVYYADTSLLNEYACKVMDDFVEAVGTKLGLTTEDLAQLKSQRIDYFLGTGDDVRRMTGFDTQGMTDLQTDAVVSRSLPHEHELTHLLVNYRQKRLPLYTLPLLQEGLAACLGGRWSKSPQAIAYQGYITLANEIGRLDDLLTRSGFNDPAVGAEVSYPIAALFTGFLLEKGGIEKYLALYTALSGSDNRVGSFDVAGVKAAIEKAYGIPWAKVAAGFEEYWRHLPLVGIAPDASQPSGDPNIVIDTLGARISIWNNPDLVHFAVDLPSDARECMLLIKDIEAVDPAYRSWLFAERLPREAYAGEHIGVRFSADEAAVYDFLTSKLQASYIHALSPQPGYRDEATGTIHFAVDAGILKKVDAAGVRLVIP